MIFVGANPVHRASDHVEPGEDEHERTRRSSSSIPEGRRPRRKPPSTCRSTRKRDLVPALRHRETPHRPGLDRPGLHRQAHRGIRRVRPARRHPSISTGSNGETGIGAGAVEDLAKRIHEAKAVSIWWTMGVNQGHQGVRTAQAIINICLMTGNIGRPGTGPNSITGQANAMGSRLYSNTTSLPAGYDFDEGSRQEEGRGRLGITYEAIPTTAVPLPQDHRGGGEGEHQGALDRRDEPGPLLDQQEGSLRDPRQASSSSWCRTSTRRPIPPGGPTCSSRRREAVRRTAPSSTPSGVSDRPEGPRSAGEREERLRDLRHDRRKMGLRGDVPRVELDPEAAFRILQRVSKGRPATSRHRGLRDDRRAGRHPVALSRRRARR